MGSLKALVLPVESLPDISLPAIEFHDTSFFQARESTSPVSELPSPAVVRAESKAQRRSTVIFKDLNLVVKFGSPPSVNLEEAQTLHAIGRLFSTEDLPVPELFGWKVDQGQNFIYMSLIEGPTLKDRWASLTQEDKKSVCSQLSQIVSCLRQIQQSPANPYIGSINSGKVQDVYFRDDKEDAGPFSTVSAFNDWVQLRAIPWVPMSKRPVDPYRPMLADTGRIYFTHGDLNIANFIVSGAPGCPKILGVLDWEQAGWYPEYWEYCKLKIPGPYNQEWHEGGWSDSIVAPYEDEWIAVSEYWMWRGCP